MVICCNKYFEVNEGENPKHIKAFKLSYDEQLNNDSTIAIVEDIVWQESKYGLLKPVIFIKPVDICGVTISTIAMIETCQ